MGGVTVLEHPVEQDEVKFINEVNVVSGEMNGMRAFMLNYQYESTKKRKAFF